MISRRRLPQGTVSVRRHWPLLLLTVLPTCAVGQLSFERDPIRYSQSEPQDEVANFARRLAAHEVYLSWDPSHGYLKSVLTQLHVPRASQTLVFSKTSLQDSRISPRTPRAIYFNDNVYVGWVQHGDLIELSAADPALGGTFYSLSQIRSDHPRIKRETSRCLQCHGSTHTRRTPGHIVRSVYPDATGRPVFRLGTHLSDHTSKFEERFGGWYVTGTHGDQRHLGNVWLTEPDEQEEPDVEAGANVVELSEYMDPTPYLTPDSDIVALMVLQHQVHVHNVLTAANHSGRLTLRDAQTMNAALERDSNFESESTVRRYQSAAKKVVQAILFCNEAMLADPVRGTSNFAEEFVSQGPFDSQGRSLRQFDLQTRLFRYPCSFLIYSETFRQLPEGVRNRVRSRLNDILAGEDSSTAFAHLTPDDRVAIREILEATLPTPADADE